MYGEAAERFSGIMSEVLANGNEEYFMIVIRLRFMK